MQCFRIDESGYTGFDLLNDQQRFQGAAAVAITDDEASKLIERHFPRLQAPELKFQSLTRRAGYRQPLLDLQRDVLTNFPCVSYVCDKRYVLWLMFVDYAVEPFYYGRGMDFYADGQNYALASLLYKAGPGLFGAQAHQALMEAFQRAMKEKSPEALEALVLAARSSRWQAMPEALGPLANADGDCLAAISNPGVSTDAAMIVLGSLINRMEVMAQGPYRVVHDESKNLLAYHDLLQQYIDHDANVEFRQTRIASVKFPLKLESVTQVNSKSSPAVQVADVMIGALVEATNVMTGQRQSLVDPAVVVSQYADDQLIHLLPSLDFAAQKEFRKGTQAGEVINYFAAHFKG